VLCKAEKCRTGVPEGRPFCTHHFKLLPYSITKNLWYAGTKQDAIKAGVAYLQKVEAA
jgi:hypothetical protein